MRTAGEGFEWAWGDPTHLEAHAKDFTRDLTEVLDLIRPSLETIQPNDSVVRDALRRHEKIWVHRDLELAEAVGWTGLKDVCKDPAPAFWGYRTGRSIPSHLCLGAKELTSWLCIWGWWEPGRFLIHTIYPGRVAPREIHDPALPVSELDQAIEFWRCHAIVVTQGEYGEDR